ncbi:MAG: PIN domain-containing protein, partial [Pirellula sp.]
FYGRRQATTQAANAKVKGMIFLLDTDQLIFMVRGLKTGRRVAQRKKALKIVGHCQRHQASGGSVGLSAVTLSELESGAHNRERYTDEIAAVRKVLTPFEIYDYDGVQCPLHYGRIRYELAAKGVMIGAMDLLIAAHALALDATLVSNNMSHFGRVTGLKVVNWQTES